MRAASLVTPQTIAAALTLASACTTACTIDDDDPAQLQVASHIGVVVGEEIELDSPVPTGTATTGDRASPAAAWNGTRWLTVWRFDGQVQAVRTASDGTVLDSTPIVLGDASENAEVAVASDGADFLVVWAGYSQPTRARRVSAAGTPLDTGPFEIAGGPWNDVALAWNGVHYLLVSSSSEISAARLDATGSVVGTPWEWMPPPYGDATNVGVSASGSAWLVTWTLSKTFPYDEDAYAVRIAADGTAGTAATITGTGGYQSHVSSGGAAAGWLVVWSDGGVVRGSRVTPAGVTFDAVPLNFTLTGGSNTRAAFDGTNWLVTWRTTDGVRGRRLSATGGFVDSSPFVVDDASGEKQSFALSAGSSVLMTWADNRSELAFEIRQLRISGTSVLDPGGDLLTPAVYTTSNGQQHVAVASNGDSFLAVWADDRDGVIGIYGSLVARNGAVLEAPIPIATEGPTEPAYPTVASDGTDYLVAWKQPTGKSSVSRTRVFASGAVETPGGTPLEYAFYPPALVSLLSWGDGRYVIQLATYDVVSSDPPRYFAYLEADGSMVGTPNSFYFTPFNAAFVWLAPQYLIVYPHTNSLMWEPADIYARRMIPPNNFVDPYPGIPVSNLGPNEGGVRAAHDGTLTLATWGSGDGGGVYGARLLADGTVLDPPTAIADGPGQQGGQSIAWDGTQFLIVWSDHDDVLGARVTSDFEILDKGGFVIAAGPELESGPAMAMASGGVALVAYQRYLDGAEYLNQRARARLVGTDGLEFPDAGVPDAMPTAAPDATLSPAAGDDGGCAIAAGGHRLGSGSGAFVTLLFAIIALSRRRQVDAPRQRR